jgi:hypothetical protein
MPPGDRAAPALHRAWAPSSSDPRHPSGAARSTWSTLRQRYPARRALTVSVGSLFDWCNQRHLNLDGTEGPLVITPRDRTLYEMSRLISFVVALAALAVLTPVAAAASAPYCQPGEVPAFRFGFAALKLQLGTGMGDPIECEHDVGGGNTWMKTTTGLAYYQSSTNTPNVIVTISRQTYRWALAPSGVAFWQGNSADPPETAPIVSDTICRTSVDSTLPFDPLRSACIALLVTELGDPFAPATTTAPPTVVAPSVTTAAPSGAVVDSYIDGDFTGWGGETVFRLRNGQIWQQASYAYEYSYAYSPRVLIFSVGGAWRMQVEGVTDTIEVRQLR